MAFIFDLLQIAELLFVGLHTSPYLCTQLMWQVLTNSVEQKTSKIQSTTWRLLG